MKIRLNAVALAAATFFSLPAVAQTQFGEHVTLSGFGTLGVVSSDSKAVDFVRDGAPEGAGRDASWKVDSKLGLQAHFTATDWLSGTVQVLTEQRYEPDLTADFEWAFVRIKPLDGLSIRLGRTAPAMFMVSDTRNVGYANTLVRQPNEVYSLAGLKQLDGGDISYSFGMGSTNMTVQGFFGKSKFDTTVQPDPFEAEKVRGLNVVWDTPWGSFRAGQVTADVIVTTILGPVPRKVGYEFRGVGYQWDDGTSLFAAEYVERNVPAPLTSASAKGWSALGGYRFGKFLPYVMVANGKVPSDSPIAGDQRTYAAGVRWDVMNGAAVKLQLEHVDPKGGLGSSFSLLGTAPREKANVLSLAVDFVF